MKWSKRNLWFIIADHFEIFTDICSNFQTLLIFIFYFAGPVSAFWSTNTCSETAAFSLESGSNYFSYFMVSASSIVIIHSHLGNHYSLNLRKSSCLLMEHSRSCGGNQNCFDQIDWKIADCIHLEMRRDSFHNIAFRMEVGGFSIRFGYSDSIASQNCFEIRHNYCNTTSY